ncbi:MAG: hypothetical protein QOF20_2099 [Acidimicrobiaceae bacterium]|nr:hypothetical protein [Acidimicrobiaceae bacterium]MDQ1369746.1 hypothetical protein [Acidimicrobiaceae bacterium]MDQ1376590.1 hypothetical protein [Acidimicrobiaceae bacterium]MDQ1419015.1 hypothetical protein [Acidimicrobiaceae bacterium]
MYAGSSVGRDPAFEQAAQELGLRLAKHELTLIYGGGAIGLMAAVADATLDAGGRVIGVIPRGLFRREIAHQRLTELIEVASMHERKQTMFELADAFVALPGGLGTFEELTEMATWAQLGIHNKPMLTLDVNGYWKPFHALLHAAANGGFMKQDNRRLIVNVERVDDVIPTLQSYEVPFVDKWLDLDLDLEQT